MVIKYLVMLPLVRGARGEKSIILQRNLNAKYSTIFHKGTIYFIKDSQRDKQPFPLDPFQSPNRTSMHGNNRRIML